MLFLLSTGSQDHISRSDQKLYIQKDYQHFLSILCYDNIQTNKYRHFDNSRYKLCKIRLFTFGWRPRHLAALGINKFLNIKHFRTTIGEHLQPKTPIQNGSNARASPFVLTLCAYRIDNIFIWFSLTLLQTSVLYCRHMYPQTKTNL